VSNSHCSLTPLIVIAAHVCVRGVVFGDVASDRQGLAIRRTTQQQGNHREHAHHLEIA
jgi:hypothetical protein